jgi:hypothetical protein
MLARGVKSFSDEMEERKIGNEYVISHSAKVGSRNQTT